MLLYWTPSSHTKIQFAIVFLKMVLGNGTRRLGRHLIGFGRLTEHITDERPWHLMGKGKQEHTTDFEWNHDELWWQWVCGCTLLTENQYEMRFSVAETSTSAWKSPNSLEMSSNWHLLKNKWLRKMSIFWIIVYESLLMLLLVFVFQKLFQIKIFIAQNTAWGCLTILYAVWYTQLEWFVVIDYLAYVCVCVYVYISIVMLIFVVIQ